MIVFRSLNGIVFLLSLSPPPVAPFSEVEFADLRLRIIRQGKLELLFRKVLALKMPFEHVPHFNEQKIIRTLWL